MSFSKLMQTTLIRLTILPILNAKARQGSISNMGTE
jgi:hypothetical protein